MSVSSKNYDIVIVGAGPAGLTTACTLSALHETARICVLDTREANTRGYGLKIASDAIEAHEHVLQANNERANKLKNHLAKWKNTTQRTRTIESELTVLAQEFGVKIKRNKEFKPYLTADKIKQLLMQDTQCSRGIEIKLRKYFASCQIIIGADGAHSAVRQAFMGPDDTNLTDVKFLAHLIELKFETSSHTRPRNFYDVSGESSVIGPGMEQMGVSENGSTKPVTFLYLCDETTYNEFSNESWSLDELRQKAQTNARLQLEYASICYYLERREGIHSQIRVKRLPVRTYASKVVSTVYRQKIVAIIGDAYSGLVWQRGYNKLFYEVEALCQSVSPLLQRTISPVQEIPDEFIQYNDKVRTIFQKELKQAEIKGTGFKAARLSLLPFSKPLHFIGWPLYHPSTRTCLKTMLFMAIAWGIIVLALYLRVAGHPGFYSTLLQVGVPTIVISTLAIGLFAKYTERRRIASLHDRGIQLSVV